MKSPSCLFLAKRLYCVCDDTVRILAFLNQESHPFLSVLRRSFAGFGAITRILLHISPFTSRGIQWSVGDSWTKQENLLPLSGWPTLRVPDKCMTYTRCLSAEDSDPSGGGEWYGWFYGGLHG